MSYWQTLDIPANGHNNHPHTVQSATLYEDRIRGKITRSWLELSG
jgi:hypothetical protein